MLEVDQYGMKCILEQIQTTVSYTPSLHGSKDQTLPTLYGNDLTLFAGLIGGYAYYYGTTTNVGTPSIIYAGRCYQSVTTVVDGESTDVFQCYDLHYGEVYWQIYPLPTVTTTSMFGPIDLKCNTRHRRICTTRAGSVPGAVAQNTYC